MGSKGGVFYLFPAETVERKFFSSRKSDRFCTPEMVKYRKKLRTGRKDVTK